QADRDPKFQGAGPRRGRRLSFPRRTVPWLGNRRTGSNCAGSTRLPSRSTRWKMSPTTSSKTATIPKRLSGSRRRSQRPRPSRRPPRAPRRGGGRGFAWRGVNDASKPVATFEYAQKEAAHARAAELTAKGKGTHFVQKTKEPMPDDAPGLGAAIPRTPPAP